VLGPLRGVAAGGNDYEVIFFISGNKILVAAILSDNCPLSAFLLDLGRASPLGRCCYLGAILGGSRRSVSLDCRGSGCTYFLNRRKAAPHINRWVVLIFRLTAIHPRDFRITYPNVVRDNIETLECLSVP
jgi:hypothetical protein